MKEKLVVSFSGGKTSAFMARMLQLGYLHAYDMVFIFANTGSEMPETLEFVNKCDKSWGLNVVWLEAVPQKGRKGTTFKIVDFSTSSRNGEPFERVIEKYGIPNMSYPHCTRELKLAPIYSYAKTIGFSDAKHAVGIRSDEPHRIKRTEKILYPLVDLFPSNNADIEYWWEGQMFKLNLNNYQGNCAWCWKKSLSKHLRLINENPHIYDFPARMEEVHGNTNSKYGARSFFRGNRSVKDLFSLTRNSTEVIMDDSVNACGESCEAILHV